MIATKELFIKIQTSHGLNEKNTISLIHYPLGGFMNLMISLLSTINDILTSEKEKISQLLSEERNTILHSDDKRNHILADFLISEFIKKTSALPKTKKIDLYLDGFIQTASEIKTGDVPYPSRGMILLKDEEIKEYEEKSLENIHDKVVSFFIEDDGHFSVECPIGRVAPSFTTEMYNKAVRDGEKLLRTTDYGTTVCYNLPMPDVNFKKFLEIWKEKIAGGYDGIYSVDEDLLIRDE